MKEAHEVQAERRHVLMGMSDTRLLAEIAYQLTAMNDHLADIRFALDGDMTDSVSSSIAGVAYQLDETRKGY